MSVSQSEKLFLFVTANKNETDALLSCGDGFFSHESEQSKLDHDANFYNVGKFGCYNAVHLELVDQASAKTNASILAVSNAIEAYHPDAVILIGVAFGADDGKGKRQIIGDVLVSKTVFDYESGVIREGKLLSDGIKAEAGKFLVNTFSAYSRTWKFDLAKRQAECFLGNILSGDKFVDDNEFKTQLLELEPLSYGGEMEGRGAYAACRNRDLHEWIIVKGICDWGDGKTNRRKQANQKLAAESATSLLMHIFSDPKAFHKLPKYGSVNKPNGNTASRNRATTVISRIIRLIKRIQRMFIEELQPEKSALEMWRKMFSPTPINNDLYQLLYSELTLCKQKEVLDWQESLSKLIRFVANKRMLTVKEGQPSKEEDVRIYNSETALLAAHSACARVTNKVFPIDWVEKNMEYNVSVGYWLKWLCSRRTAQIIGRKQFESDNCYVLQVDELFVNRCLNHIDFKRCIMPLIDLYHADLTGSDLSNSWLNFATLNSAELKGANLTKTVFADADMRKASFEGAVLIQADFSNANLKDAQFISTGHKITNLTETVFAYADVQNALFNGANLKRADFSNANLEGAHFTDADLRNITVKGTNFRGAFLNNAKLMNTNLTKADLQGVDLVGAHLEEAVLRAVDFGGADLRCADLREIIIGDTNFKGAKLHEAQLIKTSLSGADLQGVELVGADLSGADLRGADLSNADIRYADMKNANLSNIIDKDNKLKSGADLRGANLRRADLRCADMRKANLSNIANDGKILKKSTNLRRADLRGADLKGADLRGADLSYADLRKAKLSNVKIDDAKLRGVKYDGPVIDIRTRSLL